MNSVLVKLDDLELKVRRMGQRLEALKKENDALIEENIKLKQILEKKDTQISRTEKNAKNTGVAAGNNHSQDGAASTDKQRISQQLELYIQEIDKCVDMLQNI